MSDKRRSPRLKLRIRCEVVVGPRERGLGTVVDASRGGFALQTGLDLKRSQTVDVELLVPGREPVALKACVGNHRHLKRPGGQRARVYGLTVAQPPESYLALVDLGEAPPELPGDDWRVRAQAAEGPRTRNLTIDARSQEEAARRAKVKLGEGWKILSVERKLDKKP